MAGEIVDLKNSTKKVILTKKALNFFKRDPEFKKVNFLNNLRLHSSGYAFFQKNFPLKKGGYRNLTIYLHRAVADKYLKKPRARKKYFVRLKDGNPLNCQIENIEWVTMSELRRRQNSFSNATGYRGVVQVAPNKFRAVMYNNGKRFDLGLYDTAEAAAYAYNKKSLELFGETDSINKIDKRKLSKLEKEWKARQATPKKRKTRKPSVKAATASKKTVSGKKKVVATKKAKTKTVATKAKSATKKKATKTTPVSKKTTATRKKVTSKAKKTASTAKTKATAKPKAKTTSKAKRSAGSKTKVKAKAPTAKKKSTAQTKRAKTTAARKKTTTKKKK